MSKRKLTRRQKWRIEKIQAEKEQRLLKNESDIQALGEQLSSSDSRSGLVVAKHGKQVEILDLSESLNQDKTINTEDHISLCHLRANIPDMVVGDKVVWTQLENTEDSRIGIVESLSSRDSLLTRRDKHGNEKIIAANITRVFVVIAQEPETPPAVIDRYLCACELLGLKVNLLINKSDLDQSDKLFSHLKQHYQNVVNDILLCSIHNEEQLNKLYLALSDQNSVFIGQSGVGKSSLVKLLINDHSIKTKTLSIRSGLGQHTTSTSRLYALDSGGCIIDSPGIRDFDLDEVTLQELQQGFKEFSKIIEPCKFRDCVHGQEPGCKIREAVAGEKISELRYQNYIALADQLELIR